MKNYLLYIEDTRDDTCVTHVVYARDYEHAKKLAHSIAEELDRSGDFDIIYYNILMVCLEDD